MQLGIAELSFTIHVLFPCHSCIFYFEFAYRSSEVKTSRLTLDERFRDSTPRRGPDDYHAWLNAEEQRFILWGFKERWSAARIGRALGVNEATVRRFRDRYWSEPRLLLDLGLYEMSQRARSEDEFRCLVAPSGCLVRDTYSDTGLVTLWTATQWNTRSLKVIMNGDNEHGLDDYEEEPEGTRRPQRRGGAKKKRNTA